MRWPPNLSVIINRDVTIQYIDAYFRDVALQHIDVPMSSQVMYHYLVVDVRSSLEDWLNAKRPHMFKNICSNATFKVV